ncbi:MAG: isocitrate lyase/PEP mutase family protein [Pseudomonadales bacterium]
MSATLKSQIISSEPLLLPIAHDALCARLIERAGFKAYSVGGFAITGCQYGLPDIGVVSFAEMVSAVRNIMMGSDLPLLVDADEGYGDLKNVVRTVETYESMGVAGIVLEDQVSPKRCGHLQGKDVVDAAAAAEKLGAALQARKNDDFVIVARTDSLAIHGIDDAIRRAELYADTGADVIFVEAPGTVDEIKIIADRLAHKAPLLINMGEGGRTPILDPETLGNMGYSVIVYPSTLLNRVVRAIQDGLESISQGKFKAEEQELTVKDLAQLFGIEKWIEIETNR